MCKFCVTKICLPFKCQYYFDKCYMLNDNCIINEVKTFPHNTCLTNMVSYNLFSTRFKYKDEYEKFKLVLSIIGFMMSLINLLTSYR